MISQSHENGWSAAATGRALAAWAPAIHAALNIAIHPRRVIFVFSPECTFAESHHVAAGAAMHDISLRHAE
jgi:hypothetical protein